MKWCWKYDIVFYLIIFVYIYNFFLTEKKGRSFNSVIVSSKVIFIEDKSLKNSVSLGKDSFLISCNNFLICLFVNGILALLIKLTWNDNFLVIFCFISALARLVVFVSDESFPLLIISIFSSLYECAFWVETIVYCIFSSLLFDFFYYFIFCDSYYYFAVISMWTSIRAITIRISPF